MLLVLVSLTWPSATVASDDEGGGYVLPTQAEHFVGAFRQGDGRIVVFDPASGRVQVFPEDQLAAAWSGYGVEIVLPPVVAGP